MKVTIESHQGRLRLRWQDPDRRTLVLGLPDTPVCRSKAGMVKNQIELDWQTGQYDPTLLKYRPRTTGKNASEISAPELFARFTQHRAKEKGLAKSTIATKYKVIERQLSQYLDLPASSITKSSIGKLLEVWAKNLRSDIAKQRIWLLKSAWDWAKTRYQIAPENPWAGAGISFRPQPKKKIDPFDAEEVSRILDALRSSTEHSHYLGFAAFLLGTGARVGEAIGLRWSHLARDFTSVHICESRSKGVVSGGKTGKARTVPLSPSLAAILKAKKESVKPKPDDLVFRSHNGAEIDRDNFRSRVWRPILKEAGVPYRTTYNCRHTAVSYALAGGANYISVARATGHSPNVMHENYAGSIEKGSVFVDFGSPSI